MFTIIFSNTLDFYNTPQTEMYIKYDLVQMWCRVVVVKKKTRALCQE